MKNHPARSVFLTLLVALPLLVSSCVSNSETSFPSQVQLGMEVAYLDSTYKLNGDSIRVQEVRFIIGDSFFLTSNDDSVFTTNQTGMVTFDENTPNPGGITGRNFPAAVYEGFTLTIPKAPTNNQAIADDFVTDGKRYTIIAEGTYNGESFKYKSERAIEPEFTLSPPLQVSETNERYTFLVRTDVRDWFTDNQSQQLYDPGVADNSTAINDNIEGGFSFHQLQ